MRAREKAVAKQTTAVAAAASKKGVDKRQAVLFGSVLFSLRESVHFDSEKLSLMFMHR